LAQSGIVRGRERRPARFLHPVIEQVAGAAHERESCTPGPGRSTRSSWRCARMPSRWWTNCRSCGNVSWT